MIKRYFQNLTVYRVFLLWVLFWSLLNVLLTAYCLINGSGYFYYLQQHYSNILGNGWFLCSAGFALNLIHIYHKRNKRNESS